MYSNEMPIQDALGYCKLKKKKTLFEIILDYPLNTEGDRNFKSNADMSNGEYVNRMKDLMGKWVREKGVESFEQMFDLVAQYIKMI